MKVLKWFLSIFLILIVAFLIFYFWASGGSSSQKLFLIHEITGKPIAADSTFTVMTYNVGYLSGLTNNQATRPAEVF